VFILPINNSAGGLDANALSVLRNHRVCKSAMMLVAYTGPGYLEDMQR
jgi:hypothetical protein